MIQSYTHDIPNLASPIELIDERNIRCPQCRRPFGMGPASLAGALKNLRDNHVDTKACRDNMHILGRDRNPTKQKGILAFFNKGKLGAVPTTTSAPTVVPSRSGPSSQTPPNPLAAHTNDNQLPCSRSTSPLKEPAPISETNSAIDILESWIALLPSKRIPTVPRTQHFPYREKSGMFSLSIIKYTC